MKILLNVKITWPNDMAGNNSNEEDIFTNIYSL